MLSWMTSHVSPRPLGLARIVVGGACVLRAVVAWPILSGLTDPELVKIPYAEWLPLPTRLLIVSIVIVWFISAILFTIGWGLPFTGPFLLAAIVGSLTLDQQTYDNHVYLMVWLVLLLTLADSGAGMSIRRRDRPVVRWPLLLLMIQLSVVYGFSGLTKLNGFFLSGATLGAVLRDGVIPFPEYLRTPAVLSMLAGTVVLIELFIALMIWRPSFRPAAFVLGLGLHASITLLMASTLQLLVFSLEMLALYPLFLDQRALVVTAPQGSTWRRSVERFDLLKIVRFREYGDELALTHYDRITKGPSAHTRILEHLVPWLWFAPLLRVPGFNQLHQRWHRRSSENRLSASGVNPQ